MRVRNLQAAWIVAVAVTGCAEFRAPTSWFGSKPVPVETAKNPVHRMVTVWQATDGRLDGLPGRGFAGQILFFPQTGETPVKIEGDVRIYVFDDQGSPEEQSKPIHQFDFPEGSLNKQLVAGSLGPTYQVFIPYTRKGPHEARCSMRMRYTPQVGRTVYSEVVSVTLPGTQNSRGDSVVAVPQRSVPRVSNGDDVDTIRLERAREVKGRFGEVQQASAEEPSRHAATPPRSAVELAQAAKIAQLEEMLAERLGGVTPPTADESGDDLGRDSFVDHPERSTPLQRSAIDRRQPRFQPIEFSRPAATTREFDHERFDRDRFDVDDVP